MQSSPEEELRVVCEGLFVSEGDRGVNSRRASCGQKACEESDAGARDNDVYWDLLDHIIVSGAPHELQDCPSLGPNDIRYALSTGGPSAVAIFERRRLSRTRVIGSSPLRDNQAEIVATPVLAFAY